MLLPLPVLAVSAGDAIVFAAQDGENFSSAVVVRSADAALIYTAGGSKHQSGSISVQMSSGKSYSASYLGSVSNVLSVWKCADSAILKEAGAIKPARPASGDRLSVYYSDYGQSQKFTTSFTGEYDHNGSKAVMKLKEKVPSVFHPCPVVNSKGELVGVWISEDIVYTAWFDEQQFKSASGPTYTMKDFKAAYGTDQYKAGFWGQSKIRRNQVKHIIFQDSFYGMGSDWWDVSEKQDGSIKAWFILNTLFVGSEGRIAPNPNSAGLFTRFGSCQSIDFGGVFDTSNVTDMNHMFYWCDNLSNLDVTCFDTSKVTNMNGMFAGLISMTNLDLSSFDTRNVTDMGLMFESDKKLTSLYLSNFNTDKVKAMNLMFGQCWSIKTLDISSFTSKSLTNTDRMFYGCTGVSCFLCNDSKIQAKFKSK